MIGQIAGEIIGSPYVKNPRPDAASMFFPLFQSTDRLVIDREKGQARSYTYDARPGVVSALTWAAARWMMGGDTSAEAWEALVDGTNMDHPTALQALAVCVPAVMLSHDVNEAIQHVTTLMGVMKPQGDALVRAMDFTRLLSGIRNGMSDNELSEMLTGAGYDVSMGTSEIRPFITGGLARDDKGNITLGDGKQHLDFGMVVPAAFAALRESRSFEEAVRRAVCVGADSSLIAGLAGAMAQMRWEVPVEIRDRAMDFFGEGERNLLNRSARFQNMMKTDNENRSIDQVNGTKFGVIRMEGSVPVYVVPEDRKDIEVAVEKLNRDRGYDYRIIRPEDFESVFSQMAEQVGRDGRRLDGTYAEHPRPELRHLWFQDGSIRSAYTRQGVKEDGNPLKSVSKRQQVFAEFADLKKYAESVRNTLEEKAGWNPAKGMGIEDFNSFLANRAMAFPKYRKAVDKLTAAIDKVAATPGYDSVSQRVILMGKEAYGQHLLSAALGEPAAEYIGRRVEKEINTMKGDIYSKHIKALQKRIKDYGDPSLLTVKRRANLDNVKAELKRFTGWTFDQNEFFNGAFKKVCGKDMASVANDISTRVSAELFGRFLPELDKQYDAYRLSVSDINRSLDRYGNPAKVLKVLKSDAKDFFSQEQLDGLRSEYDAMVEGLKGKHLHFASAMYPVVLDSSIEVWQGDILRGRVHIDDDGRFCVDTNALTGGVHTEGLDGVMATQNIFTKSNNITDVKLALDRFVLDGAKIPDEDERHTLVEGDDDEIASIKRKYGSNVDRAMSDMPMYMEHAVLRDVRLPGEDVSEEISIDGGVNAGKREERRQESEERYAGKSMAEVKDSERFPGSVFTIGHSNMKAEEFDGLLKRYGIEVLVDIRSITSSKYNPQFDKVALSDRLRGEGVEYHHFPEFGGRQYEYRDKEGNVVTFEDFKESYAAEHKGRKPTYAEFVEAHERRPFSYEEIMSTKEFRHGMDCLLDCVGNGTRVALMCSEGDPMECHRMVMMGRALAHPECYFQGEGPVPEPVDVEHITRAGYLLSQSYFEDKMMKTYGLDDMVHKDTVRSGMAASMANVASDEAYLEYAQRYAARHNGAMPTMEQFEKSPAFRKAAKAAAELGNDVDRAVADSRAQRLHEAYTKRGQDLVNKAPSSKRQVIRKPMAERKSSGHKR